MCFLKSAKHESVSSPVVYNGMLLEISRRPLWPVKQQYRRKQVKEILEKKLSSLASGKLSY